MLQMAHIRFDGGALLLPARDPYDREVVFEQAEFYVRRYGTVALQLGRADLRAARSESESGLPCSRCHKPVGWIGYHLREKRFCSHCAKLTAR
jgi:hypothetical protein